MVLANFWEGCQFIGDNIYLRLQAIVYWIDYGVPVLRNIELSLSCSFKWSIWLFSFYFVVSNKSIYKFDLVIEDTLSKYDHFYDQAEILF